MALLVTLNVFKRLKNIIFIDIYYNKNMEESTKKVEFVYYFSSDYGVHFTGGVLYAGVPEPFINTVLRFACLLWLLCLCHAAPPTAVSGVHNSTIANAIIILLKNVHCIIYCIP